MPKDQKKPYLFFLTVFFLAFAVAGGLYFFAREKVPQADADQPSALENSQEISKEQVDLPAQAPSQASFSSNQKESKAPVAHKDTLAVIEAAKDFDSSFPKAVEEGRTEFAAELVERKMMESSQSSSQLYDWLTPYLDQNVFLWQNDNILQIYWSACVSSGCDQKSLRSKISTVRPDYVAKEGACLDSWSAILTLVNHAAEATDAKIRASQPLLIECLQKSGVKSEETLTQLQYYLRLLESKSGREKAEREFYAIRSTVLDLPPLDEILPQHPARL